MANATLSEPMKKAARRIVRARLLDVATAGCLVKEGNIPGPSESVGATYSLEPQHRVLIEFFSLNGLGVGTLPDNSSCEATESC